MSHGQCSKDWEVRDGKNENRSFRAHSAEITAHCDCSYDQKKWFPTSSGLQQLTSPPAWILSVWSWSSWSTVTMTSVWIGSRSVERSQWALRVEQSSGNYGWNDLCQISLHACSDMDKHIVETATSAPPPPPTTHPPTHVQGTAFMHVTFHGGFLHVHAHVNWQDDALYSALSSYVNTPIW